MAFSMVALSFMNLASSLLLLSLASSAISTTPIATTQRISIEQLRSALTSSDSSGINLHQLLHDSNGILRIVIGNDNDNTNRASFSDLRKSALKSLCDCPTFRPALFEEALAAHPKDVQKIGLPDGTVRRTLATATVGMDRENALEIPSWVEDTCGRNARDLFEDLRDVVADAVDVFVEKLDEEKKEGGVKDRGSYRQILSGANHLEHFHVYTKSSDTSGGDSKDQNLNAGGNDIESTKKETSTLDYHTDAGFFLSFVPAMNCHSHTIDNGSFYVEGQKEPLIFAEDEVVIMMGAGAQYWLPSRETGGEVHEKKSYPFLAASHALRLSQGTHRTWYGKMHLLPSSLTASNVVPWSSSPSPLKYGEAMPSFQLKDFKAHVPETPVDGCGTTAFNENSLPVISHDTTGQRQSRRRLQHVGSPADCNNQTNFFCWHQCVNIPDSEHAESYVHDGYSLYCLDPAILSDTKSIPEAADPCKGGFVHNSNCKGTWHETDEDLPGYKLPYEVKEEGEEQSNSTAAAATYPIPTIEDQYCYGGTSMYMDGFTWQGTTCVIYLFRSWILTTPAKFTAAALGSILFGIVLEFVLWKRRSVYALPPGKLRLCMSALMYGVQLSMGYFIMLVIMTYSGPLFICTVGGMMLGHICFNAQDSFAKQWIEKKSKKESEEVAAASEDECNVGGTSLSNTELGSYQNGDNDGSIENGCCGTASAKSPPEQNGVATEKTKLTEGVADGATPCCQYTL